MGSTPPVAGAGASGGGRVTALLQLGFRPFYLLAGAFAALSIALWAAQYCNLIGVSYLRGPVWHAHEMLFGFTLAVVSGFLLTAVRNWTQRGTPTGIALAGIAALWIAGRILVLTPFGPAAALANTAFPLVVAAAIALPLIASGNRRNLFFVALLCLLAVAAAFTHLAQLGWVALPAWAGIRIGLDLVLFIVAVVGGRVIPMFTNNAIAAAGAHRWAWLERIALASLLLLIAADAAAGAMNLPHSLLIAILATAAIAHALRLALWHPWRTLRVPLVWILHAAYAWIPIHLVLRFLADAGMVAAPLATHALTIGVIGCMTIGMMSRTALGHTGRPLRAEEYETTMYLLILAAAVVRVFVPLVLGGAYLGTVFVSALLWSCGFALYTVCYWPILTGPRVDGLAG